MKQTNIAIVSYQNTIPFLYGLLHSDIDLNVNLLVTPPFECAENFINNKAEIALGDKVFEHENKFSYKYDLSKEWLKYTGKQFVFALWIARNSVSEHVEQEINSALKFGVENITNAVEELGNNIENSIIDKYLKENIEFELSQNKFEGLKLFLSKVKDPSPNH